MMRFLFLFMLLAGSASLFAQAPARTTVKGALKDSTGTELAYATVMLLNPKDSTLVNFSRSDDKGLFSFKNVKNTAYLLKISYVGYLPWQTRLEPHPAETNDLGTIIMKPISEALMEVVIRTAKAPLRIHGDTIEYDATTFKVPPGSTVEDLLRRLPGIEVDADGNIKAQGKDVNKVYVDGKTFFSNDPKSATKNLGAETISKVQVYNEKSEQAKLTGVDDGKKEKALNLELKEEYKKGAFGKITGAVGTSERWAGRASYNRFNEKQQLSFIGYGNNINQTGVNWEDYQEFKGQNTFSDFDNGDFGFSNGGNGRIFVFGGDDSPVAWSDGRGLSQNFGGGSNYNFDNKKTKLNLNYFYNQTELDLLQFTDKQTFLSDGSFFSSDTSTRNDFRNNHALATRIEHNIDSNDLIILKVNARFGNNTTSNLQNQYFSDALSLPVSKLNLDNSTDLHTNRLSSAVIYRHKFKKKGRSFAASGGYNLSDSDGSDNLFSLNTFFQANTFTDQIRQMNANANQTQQLKTSLLFSESINKKWYSETFYNFSQTDNLVDRQVADPENNNRRIDSLSVYYDNKIVYNRLGTLIRYSYEGLNASVGVAGQQIDLSGQYARDASSSPLEKPITRTYQNFIPNIDLKYELENGVNLGLDYTYQVTEPKLTDLQPVPNVANPAFRFLGNPDLDPESSHQLSGNLNYWNGASFSNVGINANYNWYDSKIVYNQTVELIDSIGYRTTSQPTNVQEGYAFNTYGWTNFPIIKTKLTMNLNGNYNQGQSPALVNGEVNETANQGFSFRSGLSLTPTPKLVFGLSANIGRNFITYSIRSDQNQTIKNFSTDASIKWQFLRKTFFESNFTYSQYENERFGFDQKIPVWNASVRQLLGKKNKLEVRLAAFDIFNKKLTVSQFGGANYVTRSISNTLTRYIMLSVSYNVRGYENKIKKGYDMF